MTRSNTFLAKVGKMFRRPAAAPTAPDVFEARLERLNSTRARQNRQPKGVFKNRNLHQEA